MAHAPTMSSPNKATKAGRPRVVADSAKLTITVDASMLRLADKVAVDLGEVMAGMQPTRADVFRTAIARGLETMRADIDKQTKRGSSK